MDVTQRRGAFISYSRSDSAFALNLANELRAAGYPVWLDQLDIPAGARWDDEVEKALREYEIFLIILTPASVSSENVKDEIGYAIDHGKRMMPVLLKNCNIPLRLRRFQYVDFTTMEFSDGVQRAKQLLEILTTDRSTPEVKINPELDVQKILKIEQPAAHPLSAPNKPVRRHWPGAAPGILAFGTCVVALIAVIVFRNLYSSGNDFQIPTAVEAEPTSTNTLNPGIFPTEIPPTQINPTNIVKPAMTVIDSLDVKDVWYIGPSQLIPNYLLESIDQPSRDEFERLVSYYRLYRHPSDCQSKDIRGVSLQVIFFKSDAGSRTYFTRAFSDVKNSNPKIIYSVGETAYLRKYLQNDAHCGDESSDKYLLLFQRYNAIGIASIWVVPGSMRDSDMEAWLNQLGSKIDATFEEYAK